MEIIAGAFGLVIGSFLNVLIDRLPKNQNVIWGRSRCDHCRRTLRWFELIPVFSYIFQKGACARCNKPLSIQYPVIELLTSIGFMGLYISLGSDFSVFIPSLVLFSSIIVLFMSDLKYQILPDSMIVLGCIAAAMRLITVYPSVNIGTHVVSGLGASVLFYLLYAGTKGRGMGFGDVKLAFLLGVLLGYPLTIIAVYVAFLTGAFVGVILVMKGKKKLKSRIAFGPFLILGYAICELFQHQALRIWNMYF